MNTIDIALNAMNAVPVMVGPPVEHNNTTPRGYFADNADSVTERWDDPGPFPTNCLGPLIQATIREAAAAALAPETLTGASALAALSFAIGAGLEIASGGDRKTRGNLYIMVSAQSGSGKGSASTPVVGPLLDIEQTVLSTWRREKLPSLSAKYSLLEQSIAEFKKRSRRSKENEGDAERELTKLIAKLGELARLKAEPCHFVGDVTREALADKLYVAHRECLSSFSPEARGVMDVLSGRYHKGVTDEDLYLSAYTGERFKMDRRHSPPILLHRPCLSLLWMVQPDKIKQIMANPLLSDSGFFQRCLFVNADAEPQEEPEHRPTISAESAKFWPVALQRIFTVYRDRTDEALVITPERDAASELRAYHNEIVSARSSGGSLHDVGSYAARWSEQAWKLSLVLHVGNHLDQAHNHTLSKETASAAIRLAKWFAAQQLSLLAPAVYERRHQQINKLVQVLNLQGGKSATLRDLKRRHGIEPAEVKYAATNCPQLFRVEELRPPGAGRPSTIVRLL